MSLYGGSDDVITGEGGVELLPGQDFSAGVAGWLTAFNGNVNWVNGRLRVTATGGGSFPRAYRIISGLEVGKTYVLRWDHPVITGGGFQTAISNSTSTGGAIASLSQLPAFAGNGKSLPFVATATSHHILFILNSTTNGVYMEIDNVSLREQGEFILATGPLTRDAEWMCEVDVRPYDCA
jgi:hypothetical protein